MSYGSFQDDWVESATVFAFMSQGGCACCSLRVSTSVVDFMRQCSDLESAAEDAERRDESPWVSPVRGPPRARAGLGGRSHPAGVEIRFP